MHAGLASDLRSPPNYKSFVLSLLAYCCHHQVLCFTGQCTDIQSFCTDIDVAGVLVISVFFGVPRFQLE